MAGKIKGRKKKETGHRSTNCGSLWQSRAHSPFLLCPYTVTPPHPPARHSAVVTSVSQNSRQVFSVHQFDQRRGLLRETAHPAGVNKGSCSGVPDPRVILGNVSYLGAQGLRYGAPEKDMKF